MTLELEQSQRHLSPNNRIGLGPRGDKRHSGPHYQIIVHTPKPDFEKIEAYVRVSTYFE